MIPEPFRIEPTFSPRIWGARSLAPIFPEKKELTEPIGEAWLTDVRCRVTSGQLKGMSLDEAWRYMPLEWRGERCAGMQDFPLLVKFIFPRDKLSIQVHPDDDYASGHETAAGARGKTEMWHVVSAEPEARLLLGLKPNTTKKEFLAALTKRSLEDLLQAYSVEERETFFIPPGTPHTIGPGMILCEVQQYSDLTYRIHDYGRVDAQGKPRELHIGKALEVIKFGQTMGGIVHPLRWSSQMMTISLLLACRHFSVERWRIAERFTAKPKTDAFNLMVVLSGDGELLTDGGKAQYRTGECWFLPASLKRYELVPSGKSVFLRTFVPDLALLRQNLRSLGVSDSQIAEVVFE
ncbi:MAG TPA: type I phosphomannose isomerase catalytic subunit [Candidatus Acidoferrum sp.]|nr:type I phosphomannose isomerase catalytic subunit [Candidatus Acidoferrum sp.]